jgi:hypothetical protein
MREFDMKLDKKDVAWLLEGFSVPNFVCSWAVAERYEILNGVVYSAHPDEYDPECLDAFGDPDLFFSFARLGARGEPSESSILRWISEHGLLRQKKEPEAWTDSIEGNQAPISVADFRAEVLCAHQLLTLYIDIREENFAALQTTIYGTDEDRHPSSFWPHTPPTDLEKHFAHQRDLYGRVRERVRLKNEIGDSNESVWSDVEHWDVFVALMALQEIVRDRLSDVRLDFLEYWAEDYPLLGSDYRIPRSWACPDLLSAMYLQFYLLITDFERMRRCQNPACGLPFPATRKNKRFCNATCRSNARNYR